MKISFLIIPLVVSFFYLSASGQGFDNWDTLFYEGTSEAVIVTEVADEVIKYKYPEEHAVFSKSKLYVDSIIFSSGRKLIFESPIKEVNGLEDFKNVYISYQKEDVVGLVDMGIVSPDFVYNYSDYNDDPDYDHSIMDRIRLEAAMLGAEIVYISPEYLMGSRNYLSASPSIHAFSLQSIDKKSLQGWLETNLYGLSKEIRYGWLADSPRIIDHSSNGLFPASVNNLFTEGEAVFLDVELHVLEANRSHIIFASEGKIVLAKRKDGFLVNYELIKIENHPQLDRKRSMSLNNQQ